jgi:hypothetical protein
MLYTMGTPVVSVYSAEVKSNGAISPLPSAS